MTSERNPNCCLASSSVDCRSGDVPSRSALCGTLFNRVFIGDCEYRSGANAPFIRMK